jgi:hypothetical protein
MLTPKLADIRVATDFLCGCKTCAKDGGRQRSPSPAVFGQPGTSQWRML